MLINYDTYQRETLSERPIRQPLIDYVFSSWSSNEGDTKILPMYFQKLFRSNLVIFMVKRQNGRMYTENPEWIIWLIWAIVCHYTDKKTPFSHIFESFCPCTDPLCMLWLKWVKWFTQVYVKNLDDFSYEFWCTSIQNPRFCKWLLILNWSKWILVAKIRTQTLLTIIVIH